MSRGAAQYTTTFTVNSIGEPEPVTAHTECQRITIKEDPSVSGWPTTDYLITGSVPGSTPIRCPAGSEYIFEASSGANLIQPFKVGTIVGYIETVTGSTTFQQKEDRK